MLSMDAEPTKGCLPRFLPDESLPPYTYVPGHSPHPLSDPRGHSFGIKLPQPEPPDPQNWQSCRAYRYGLDLFNHGYYWEAHETWEGLWHACGRHDRTADFLKGLIKLAAAGVKVREGKTQGVQSHGRRAALLFQHLAQELGGEETRYLGLRLGDLLSFARQLANRPPEEPVRAAEPAIIVFGTVLRPS
jgi:hypothetical protein